MLKEFKEFAVKGNLIELAVAFILALAFAAVIGAFIDGIVMQLIAAAVGEPSFDQLAFDVNGSPIRYGEFLAAVVNFLLVAFVLFLIVKGYNRMKRSDSPAAVHACPFCTSLVADTATRCPACTSELPATAPTVPA